MLTYTHKQCTIGSNATFFSIFFMLLIILTGCVTERVIVVEKEQSPEDKYFQTFKEIVTDVELGNMDYVGKRVTIRATVAAFRKAHDIFSASVWLQTNSENISFAIFFVKGTEKTYRDGLDYTFTVKINEIGKLYERYYIYAVPITD